MSDALASIRALLEQQLDHLKRVAFMIDMPNDPARKMYGGMELVVTHSDAMHALLFVRLAVKEVSAVLASVPPPQVIPNISEAYIEALIDRLTNDAMYECHDSPVEDEIRDWCARQRSYDDFCSGCRTNALLAEAVTTIRAFASADRYPEESLATRILHEQKDLEAHTRAVTDVDRLVQIRDSLLKEPQP